MIRLPAMPILTQGSNKCRHIFCLHDLYDFNVHLGPEARDILVAIRGQLLSGRQTKLSPKQTVAPFNDICFYQEEQGRHRDHIYGCR